MLVEIVYNKGREEFTINLNGEKWLIGNEEELYHLEFEGGFVISDSEADVYKIDIKEENLQKLDLIEI